LEVGVTTEQFVAVVKALTELLGVVVWPIVLLYILHRFRIPLSDFFSSLGEFTFKALGIEATAKRKQIVDAAAAIGAAVASKPGEATQPEVVLAEAKAAAGAVADVMTPRALQRFGEATVLWVDDRPDNNRYERQALEALGVRFILSMSTDDALIKTQHRTFDAIISDMGRPPDARAGYTLLDALRARGDQTPFVIYAGSRAAEHVAESRRHGALGCTNRPQELIQMVLEALGKGTTRGGRSA
jgi:CheY-like chemotaxis protein